MLCCLALLRLQHYSGFLLRAIDFFDFFRAVIFHFKLSPHTLLHHLSLNAIVLFAPVSNGRSKRESTATSQTKNQERERHTRDNNDFIIIEKLSTMNLEL
jgi:hypothetical protein